MRRYWYYSYLFENTSGNAVCSSERGGFPLDNCYQFQKKLHGRPVIIIFFGEISSDEFEAFVNNHKE